METKKETIEIKQIEETVENDKTSQVMNQDSISGQIFITSDYEKFKHLAGNRGVSELRVRKIMDSVRKVGYVKSPILVNEKMEVIDGQGRLEAFERLEIPVEYTVKEGIGIIECRAMNLFQENWKITDWIDSFAGLGDENYIRFKKFFEEVRGDFNLGVVYAAVKGRIYSGNMNPEIKDGRLICSEEDILKARDVLKFCTRFKPMLRRIGGGLSYYDFALIWCYMDEEVKKERLFRNVEKYQVSMRPSSSVETALQELETAYNKSGKPKAYIVTNRRKYIENSVIGNAIKGKLKKGLMNNPDWLAQLDENDE